MNSNYENQIQGTFPQAMLPHPNSIICTELSQQLTDLFNYSFAPERPIQFPSRRCKNAQSRCEQCLGQTRCNVAGTYRTCK